MHARLDLNMQIILDLRHPDPDTQHCLLLGEGKYGTVHVLQNYQNISWKLSAILKNCLFNQCCGSGSGISFSQISDPTHISKSLVKQFFGLKILKGAVQRKLTGVESDINRKAFLSHWTADTYFLNFKGTCSLNNKTPVSEAKAKICDLSNSMGRPLQITDSSKPTSW